MVRCFFRHKGPRYVIHPSNVSLGDGGVTCPKFGAVWALGVCMARDNIAVGVCASAAEIKVHADLAHLGRVFEGSS